MSIELLIVGLFIIIFWGYQWAKYEIDTLNNRMIGSSLSAVYDEILSESWVGHTQIKPANKRGFSPPVETKDSLTYKQSKIGYPEFNNFNISQSSGQNPYEQEETKSISQGKVLSLIEQHIGSLDKTNNNDRIALTILADLKNKISKL